MRDTAPVRLLDLSSESAGREEWRGTLAEFFAANAENIDDAERALIIASLDAIGMHAFGGGAAPVTVLEVVPTVDLYLLTTNGLVRLTGPAAGRVMDLFIPLLSRPNASPAPRLNFDMN